ncbi:DUF6970 domain-containing protein [Membranihabitans marinus]|uniref:DUF6970 domain-containing protein n=1 Tax=Membranihabitans marinus TaxID=1227546 RepID=UPI001F444CDA|nr:hypothetical protein [Membranihabitans marinus]
MTNKYLIIALLVWSFTMSCDKNKDEVDIPTCIQAKIESLKTLHKQNPPAIVEEWETPSGTYYYITSDCCDQFNYLYDGFCNVVCAPDGGITGEGDGNCPVLTDTVVTVLWQDER